MISTQCVLSRARSRDREDIDIGVQRQRKTTRQCPRVRTVGLGRTLSVQLTASNRTSLINIGKLHLPARSLLICYGQTRTGVSARQEKHPQRPALTFELYTYLISHQ